MINIFWVLIIHILIWPVYLLALVLNLPDRTFVVLEEP